MGPREEGHSRKDVVIPMRDVVIPLDGSKVGRSFKKGCGHPNEGCGHSIIWVQGRKVIQ